MRDAYRTKDHLEAAALDAAGCPFEGLEPTGYRAEFYFVFGDKHRTLNLAQEFWAGRLMVSARDYADALRRVKDAIFSRSRTEGEIRNGHHARR